MKLYNKYRPKTIDEVVGNASNKAVITDYLENLNKNNSLLLTGDSGTGKTTLARIISAKILGIDFIDDNKDYFDYYPINSADNNGINTVREMRKNFDLRPIEGKYKVYFMDECHACTSEAQDAWLSYTEKSFKHIYFIFATSEPHRLNKAFLSRCFTVDLEKPSDDEICSLLNKIVKAENKYVEPEVIDKLSIISEGNCRKAVSELEGIIDLDVNKQDELISKKLSRFVKKRVTPYSLLKAFESITHTSTELFQKKFPKKKYFLRPFLREGSLGMVHAAAGTGKTMLIESFAAALTRTNGKDVTIGRITVEEQCGVLIVDGEMQLDELKERLANITGPMGDEIPECPLKLATSCEMLSSYNTSIRLEKKEHRKTISLYLKEFPSIKVLILDNLASLTPSISENSNESYAEFNQWLLSLRSMGVAVILVHHSTKAGHKFRGHTGRIDNLDWVIGLKSLKEVDDLCFEVEFQKFRRAKKGDGQRFTVEAVQHPDNPDWILWEEVTCENSEDKKDLRQTFIMADLLSGEKTQAEIAKTYGVSQSTVSNLKKTAVEKGLLDVKGRITLLGEEFLRMLISNDERAIIISNNA